MQPSYVYRKQTHLLDVNQHVRSRHKLYGDTSAASVRPSALATLLVRSRQWGFITDVFVQSIAAAACEDGVTHIDVTRLARLGSHGFHPQNVSTELDKIIPKCRLHDAVDLRKPSDNARRVLCYHISSSRLCTITTSTHS